jgi:hypothetical protein
MMCMCQSVCRGLEDRLDGSREQGFGVGIEEDKIAIAPCSRYLTQVPCLGIVPQEKG